MSPSAAHRVPVRALIALFLAGFSFLVYEVSWNRQLGLVLGSTVTAATLVLSAFMAGFGVGAWLWGRRSVDAGHPQRLLALLLAGIAGASAAGLLLLPRLAAALYAAGAPEPPVFALAALLLFLPALLMGGVFPAFSELAAGGRGAPAAALGRLYAADTLGAALGGLATGFLFLGLLGQRGTLLLAVLLDLGLALWLWRGRWEGVATDAGGATAEAGFAVSPAARRSALLAAFTTGLVLLSLQVLWLRMLRISLTNTSYGFALVAALVILGLCAGAALFARRARRILAPSATLIRALLLLAALAALGLVLLLRLPELIMFPLEPLLRAPLARALLLPALAALLVVFPPALISGFVFPLACAMVAGRGEALGRDVGRVQALNTLGATLGPPLAGLLLLPMLGAGLALLLTVALLLAATVFIQIRNREAQVQVIVKAATAGALALLLLVIALRPPLRITPPSFHRFDRTLLAYRETVEGTLTVGRERGRHDALRHTYVNNAAVIGATYDAVKAVKMVGHFPFLLGLEAERVLVVGFGIGVTTSAIAAHAEVRAIDCVELVPGLVDAARFYRDLNHGIATDPRLHLIGGDGRHHLLRSRERYDLISCDPTHPVLGSGALYTREYFELCRARLAPGGMVSQYLPLHKLGWRELVGLLATFAEVFPDCTVWLGQYHAVLVGGTAPLALDFADWSARVAALPADEHFYAEPYHLAASLLLDGPAIARLAGEVDARIHVDDRSYTEFFAPHCLDEGNLAANLERLLGARIAPADLFAGIPDSGRMARFERGNALLGESLVHMLAGRPHRAQAALRRAAEANPENQEYPFLLRYYY